jgi:hypothetical protein
MAGIGVTPEVRFRNQFGRFMSEVEVGVNQSLINLSVDLEQAAKRYAARHSVSGKLVGSIRGEVKRGAAVATVNANGLAPYWSFVHDGAPPHAIRKRSRTGPLTQRGGGNVNTPNDPSFFAPSGEVSHPGTRRPNPFMRKAYDEVWPTALIEVDRNID